MLTLQSLQYMYIHPVNDIYVCYANFINQTITLNYQDFANKNMNCVFRIQKPLY